MKVPHWSSGVANPPLHIYGRIYGGRQEVVVQWMTSNSEQPAFLTIAKDGDPMDRSALLMRLAWAACAAAHDTKTDVTWDDMVRFAELQRAKEILAQ